MCTETKNIFDAENQRCLLTHLHVHYTILLVIILDCIPTYKTVNYITQAVNISSCHTP